MIRALFLYWLGLKNRLSHKGQAISLFKLPLSYRRLAYFATAVTGFSALASQAIWQKHLAILTGSEARSLSLVIAVFLLGLALGYFLFGLLTEKRKWPRSQLLKYYGYVELITGLYIGAFPLYFEILKALSFNSPNWLILDAFISILALLLPTALMGASIPLLTTALPEKAGEVHTAHAKIYGWNSLGASLGALIAGFYLIPKWGLTLSLHGLGLLNVLAAMIFIGNRLKGSVQKQEDIPTAPSPCPNSFFMIFVFFTGAVIIFFETLFVRILNLSLGAGPYNFSIVLSLFVGGMALGSLSIKKQKISLSFFISQLFIALFLLCALYWTAPFWPIWISHIRISLSSLPSNYFIYQILIFLFFLLFLFPAIFFMGRLLPLAYAFAKKTKANYGKVCGLVYFFNALGTAFGAVFIGYLAFYLFNLDILFKACIYILFLLALALALYKKSGRDFIILLSLAGLLFYLPAQWNRTGHEVGYFRTRQYNKAMHFKGLWAIPQKRSAQSEVALFKDGPNSTVALIYYLNNHALGFAHKLKELFSRDISKFSSYSIIVNGKSDGNSLGDFSTMFFMIPYLHSPKKTNLETAFIGLGTGISAGSYASLKDVKSADVLEISPFVIKAIETVPPEWNFHAMKSQKVKIMEMDAFKYFTRNKKKYDIIVSEPSNPWVVGVENLFTVEFYKMISQNLNPGGVFGQWIQAYDIDLGTLEIVIKTIHQVFPHAGLYKIGHKDLLIIASLEPLRALSPAKFEQAFIKRFYKAMGMDKLENIYLSQILSPRKLSQIARLSGARVNSLTHPLLIYRANKALFLGTQADPFSLISKFHPEQKRETKKMRAFSKSKMEDWGQKCLELAGFNFLCSDMKAYKKSWEITADEKTPRAERFAHYIYLRKRGLIPYSKKMMDGFFQESLKSKNENLSALSDYVSEKIQFMDYEGANQDALAFKSHKLINERHYRNFKADLDKARRLHQKALGLKSF